MTTYGRSRETLGRCVAGAGTFALAVAGASAAWAFDPAEGRESYNTVPPVSDAELRELRGGMTVMGIEFSFGAIQTVLVDGTPVARTTFTLADSGALTRTLEILNSDLAAEFDGSPVPGMSLGSLAGLKGVLVPGENGASVALSGISPGAFTSALLNNVPGRNIAQHFDVHFSIHNFPDLQAQLGAVREASRIAGSIQSGMLTAR